MPPQASQRSPWTWALSLQFGPSADQVERPYLVLFPRESILDKCLVGGKKTQKDQPASSFVRVLHLEVGIAGSDVRDVFPGAADRDHECAPASPSMPVPVPKLQCEH